MGYREGRTTGAYQRLRAIVCRPQQGALCWLCNEPVRYDLRPRHPLGPSLDHVRPLSDGGSLLDRSNARLAHYGCNSAKGANLVVVHAVSNPSRQW